MSSTATVNIEDPTALLQYLSSTGRVAAHDFRGMRVLEGGVSSRTVLVERRTGAAWVLKQALPKLRVSMDWFSDPDRVHREALGQRWLVRLAPLGAVAEFVFEDFSQHVLAMHAVPEPHENWKQMLLAGRLQPDLVRQFGRLLGVIHRRSWERRHSLPEAFHDRSYFESLRLEPYYRCTAELVPEARTFLERLIEETLRQRITLVHGDFSPKNVLVHRDRLVLLDHEVIHVGDPAFDVGFALTHLLSKGHHAPLHRQWFGSAARAFFDEYRHELADVPWAAEMESRAVRHTLGCLLARVAGRSPLEYLSAAQRARQRAVVCQQMAQAPLRVTDLVESFLTGV